MNRIALFIALFFPGLCGFNASLISAAELYPVRVLVYDYAAVDAALLMRAQNSASSTLATAGIAPKWEFPNIGKPASSPASTEAGGETTVLLLRLQRDTAAKHLALKGWQFGYSIPSATGFGDIAGVLVERTCNFARSKGIQPHLMLGHVIAHELGHLLLGAGAHARNGIMKHSWGARELQLARTGVLAFTIRQAGRIRRQLVARASREHGVRTANLDGIRLRPPLALNFEARALDPSVRQ